MGRNLAFEFLLKEKLQELNNSCTPNNPGLVTIEQALIAFREVDQLVQSTLRSNLKVEPAVKTKLKAELVGG